MNMAEQHTIEGIGGMTLPVHEGQLRSPRAC
jgi:hypothetical protein